MIELFVVKFSSTGSGFSSEFLTFTQHLGTLGPQLVSEDPSLLLCVTWHGYTVVESRTVTLVLRRSGKALLTSTRDIHRHRELVPN